MRRATCAPSSGAGGYSVPSATAPRRRQVSSTSRRRAPPRASPPTRSSPLTVLRGGAAPTDSDHSVVLSCVKARRRPDLRCVCLNHSAPLQERCTGFFSGSGMGGKNSVRTYSVFDQQYLRSGDELPRRWPSARCRIHAASAGDLLVFLRAADVEAATPPQRAVAAGANYICLPRPPMHGSACSGVDGSGR